MSTPTSRPLRITLDDHKALLELGECFDFRCVQLFRRCFDSIDLSTLQYLTIDFSRTRYIDSAALGVLLTLQARFQPCCVSIELARVSEPIYTILRVARFDKLFLIER